ncbi:MAG: hypothetical protein ACI8S6_003294 [Myxococcota bacterium]|jgi:hypothetical protein
MLWITALLTACTHDVPPPTPVVAVEPVVFDYGPLYGGFSSMGAVDRQVAGREPIQRVVLEASALSSMRPDSSVEPWARLVLLSALRQLGALVIVPGGANPPPIAGTIRLTDLHFGTGTDTLPAVVRQHEEDGRTIVAIRQYHDEPSLCPPELMVTLPYVALHATVQRESDGAVAAIWHEVVLPEIDAERAQRTVSIPAAQRCEVVPALLERDPDLQPTGIEYHAAAAELVQLALRPLRLPAP